MVANKRDIYNSEKRVKTLLEKSKKYLNRYDAQTLKEFAEFLYYNRNLEHQTIYELLKYLYDLSFYYDVRLKSINKHNIIEIKNIVDQHTKDKLKSKEKFYTAIRHLLRFINKDDLLEYFTLPRVPKKPNFAITEPEVIYKVIMEMRGQHKIITMLLWETGARVKEVFSIKREDINLLNDLALIKVGDIKKGYERIVIVKEFYDEFVKYLSSLPYNQTYIFNTTYFAYRKELRRASKILNLYKPLTPKLFRKFRATYMAMNVNETTLRAIFGWSFRSDVPRHYIELSRLLNYETINKFPTLKELMRKKFIITQLNPQSPS